MSSSYPIPAKLRVLDSHTGGEPTRVVLDASLDLGSGSMAARRDRFRADFDRFRSAVVNEPRGSEAVVGALLCEPVDPTCDVGAIFFNNVGFLGMCGHATIGLGVSLAQTGRLEPGQHRLDTPVGVVPFEVHEDRRSVTLENIVSYRTHAGVEVTVRGRTMSGEVAWGGNWFYLVDDHGQELEPENAEELTEISLEMRAELEAQGIAGDDGAEVDHVELMGPSPTDGIDGRSFVLCPGGAWDRSPCGTGTSAKVAWSMPVRSARPQARRTTVPRPTLNGRFLGRETRSLRCTVSLIPTTVAAEPAQSRPTCTACDHSLV